MRIGASCQGCTGYTKRRDTCAMQVKRSIMPQMKLRMWPLSCMEQDGAVDGAVVVHFHATKNGASMVSFHETSQRERCRDLRRPRNGRNGTSTNLDHRNHGTKS